jgi:hypothetical protein
MDNVKQFDSPICLSNADFARNLRHFADLLDGEDPIYTAKHMLIVVYTESGHMMRESYGVKDFSKLEALGMLEFAKLKIFDPDGPH